MSIYINDCNKVNEIFINVNGKKKVKSIYVNREGNPVKVFSNNALNIVNGIKIVSWADGTDEEIATMLYAHYSGLIDIHNYWHVGDERVVHLSAMDTGVVRETHIAQDIIMVLVDSEVKYLQKSINGITKCAFVVCCKNPLIEPGVMNLSGADSGGWIICKRRTWCNSTFMEALPQTFRELFKLHRNYSGDQNHIRTTTYDYFALLSEKEFCGTTHASNSSAESLNFQFAYFKNIDNQETTYVMWTRSEADGSSSNCFVAILPKAYENDTDLYGKLSSNSKLLIRPFGCI